MEIEKIKHQEGLLKEQNIEIKNKNHKLSLENEKLKKTLETYIGLVQELQGEQQKLSSDFEKEQKRWEDTTNSLKKVIADLDFEKKLMENEMSKLTKVSERCNRAEYLVVELKYSLEQINESRNIEKESAKEQIDTILEELNKTRHDKEEILSEKLMLENEILKHKHKIAMLEDKVKESKKGGNKKTEIFNWCMERKNRRDLIRNKQNRVYGPQSTKNLKDVIRNKA